MQSNPYLKVDLKSTTGVVHEGLMFDSGMVGLYDLSLSTYDTVSKLDMFSVMHEAKGAFSLGLHGVENQTKHYKLLLPELDFAGVTFKNITTTTTSDSHSRIGSQMFMYGDIIIDYPGRQLYFNPYTDGIIDLAEKTWPVQSVFKDGKLVVGIVWDSAYDDRINEGDEIIKFGDTDYSEMDSCEKIILSTKPEVETAIMVLKDKYTGEIKNVELVKK